MLNKKFLKCYFIILIYGILISRFSLKAQTFERIEIESGLSTLEENNGVSVADYDKDNDLDIFVVAKAKDKDGVEISHSKLFRNNNDGTFTDVTESSGIINLLLKSENTKSFESSIKGDKHGAFWGDYDNDGYPDIFFTNSNKNLLFHNKGNGTFIDVTENAGIKKYDSCDSTGATWFDYNKDGFLDLYICDWSKDCDGNSLYKNNGDGTFTNVSNIFKGILDDKFAFLAFPFDFNNDGWLDLLVANDSQAETNELFINNQGTGFTEQAEAYNLDNSKNDMGVAIGDYNNDGNFDFYITAIFNNTFYKKTAKAKYTDIAESLGVKNTGWAWDVNFSDFDLDRDEDLFVVNGYKYGNISNQKNVYFENLYIDNNGVEGFIDSSEKTKLDALTISVGAAVFDYDNDGDLDLFVTNNDSPSYFYENKIRDFTQEKNNLHWLKIKLQGTVSNRDAIGTTISIKTHEGSDGILHRYYTGIGFISQSLQPVHFGLGKQTKVLELKISWPSGLVEIYKNLPVDKTILAIENNGFSVLESEPSVKIYGCTDPYSCNYNPNATISSGSCNYLEPDEISGNTNPKNNSIEIYTYPSGINSDLNWDVSGGQIIEEINNSIKIKWGAQNQGTISLIENNGQCHSEKIELNISLSEDGADIDKNKPSVARVWNEALLEGIRKDYARPTVHARNLFHTSIAMYDAWAVFDDNAETYLLGKQVHNFNNVFNGFTPSEDIEISRHKAISYAAYRLLTHRFKNSPNKLKTQEVFNSTMDELGYDKTITSVDYSDGDGAALGNFIAQIIINYGFTDGSNEINQYKNSYYEPVNEPLNLLAPDDISNINPNRWQPLKFNSFIDQSGNIITGTTPSFLGPEWGKVLPFALKEDDQKNYQRSGNTYSVYDDPGPPPYLNTTESTSESDSYKWAFALVSKWGAQLDPKDGVIWDISPKSIGNIDLKDFPSTYSEYPNFYKEIDGGDIGKGHALNPYTNQPYKTQLVHRADYARVLAEFWADGPDSETPPGHWFTILNYINDNPLLEKKFKGKGDVLSNLEWDVKSYFILGGAMHDSAISAWGIKGWYDYIRPISAIRYMAKKGQSSDPSLENYNVAGIPLDERYIEIITENDPLVGANNENLGKIKLYSWKGHDYINNPEVDEAGVGWILAENWWPYQRPTFVTPPFAGYVSGHSTYSRAAAEVLTLLTGNAYFPGGYGEFLARKNDFLVFEEGPSQDIKLQWATYRDASDQCSLSRIWGGIHPPIDDIPGRIIGEKIGVNTFNFATQYFNNQQEFPEDDSMILNAYPNPVSDELVINIREKFGRIKSTKKISFYNMLGEKVLTKITDRTDYKINLQFLSSGIYILEVSNGQKNIRKIIVKE